MTKCRNHMLKQFGNEMIREGWCCGKLRSAFVEVLALASKKMSGTGAQREEVQIVRNHALRLGLSLAPPLWFPHYLLIHSFPLLVHLCRDLYFPEVFLLLHFLNVLVSKRKIVPYRAWRFRCWPGFSVHIFQYRDRKTLGERLNEMIRNLYTQGGERFDIRWVHRVPVLDAGWLSVGHRGLEPLQREDGAQLTPESHSRIWKFLNKQVWMSRFWVEAREVFFVKGSVWQCNPAACYHRKTWSVHLRLRAVRN